MLILLNLEAGHRRRHSEICWFECCNTRVRKATRLLLCVSRHIALHLMTSAPPRV